MSNISNRQIGFEKEAGLNVKNAIRTVKGGTKKIFEPPRDIKVSRNLDELSQNIKKSGLKTKDNIRDIMKDSTKTDFGLTGMIGGGAKWLGQTAYNKIPQKVKGKLDTKIVNPAKEGLNPVLKAAKRKREKFDKDITNLDMKLGNLGYKYAPGKTKNIFVGTKKVELEPRNKSGANEYADFKITQISEPVRKARGFVVPIAGGAYIADKMEKLKYKTPEQQALDNIDKQSFYSEDGFIDKVSYMLENKGVKQNTNISAQDFGYYLNKMSKLASQASTQLMLASYENKSLMEKISQLEVEKELIKIAYENEARERNAKEVATEMVEKGLINKCAYEDKVKDLYQMDKQSFEIFKKTIDDIKIQKQASDCQDGVDSLQFILGDSDNRVGKQSMAEAFSQF